MAFETGEVAECLSKKNAEVCYRAALDNPGHPKLSYFLGPACRGRLGDSCRLRYEHSLTTGESLAASTAMRIGCETGDEYLCGKYLEAAKVTEDKAQRDWIVEFVRKSRAANGAAVP
jgi:hypothetical protein